MSSVGPHQVCELMFVESRNVSHTAAEFATHYLFSDDFMTRARQAKVPKGIHVYTLLIQNVIS